MNRALRIVLPAVAIALVSISCSFGDVPFVSRSREQRLPSGKTATILWMGIAYGDQRADDEIMLHIQAHASLADRASVEKEAIEAFELIRPTCELWDLHRADVSVYTNAQATGDFLGLQFSRNPDGTWGHQAMPGHSSRLG